jgi:predicted nucleic acid-binding protein
MRALLDTSVLIGGEQPPDIEAAISVASLAELHFGVLVADDDDERALRTQRLGAIESTFEALLITAEIAREWGAIGRRGAQPRRPASSTCDGSRDRRHRQRASRSAADPQRR